MAHVAPISEPVGNWWAAFDDGSVWPVRVISTNMFGTRVVATHEAAPQGEIVLHPSRVYDSEFNRPKKVFDGKGVEDEQLAREELIRSGVMPADVREAIADGKWEEA